MKYPSAHWKISGDYLNHPDNELDASKLRAYDEKVQEYEAVYTFKNEQTVKYLEQSLRIMGDAALCTQEKQKKMKNLREKLLRKEVCDYAEKLKTCVKDRRPFKSAHFTPQCPLHMHCIGGKSGWMKSSNKPLQ